MTSLQKVVLGTPPSAVDGDTVRVANTKANANVDVLNTQAALTSATGITAAQALTAANIGKRINIALAAAGVINLPSASTCAADNVLLLRNIGTTVVTLAITAGSGDTIALSKLNPGEAALMDTDGVHAWTVLMRGRTNSDNEIVNGNCTVNGNETVGGTLSVTGNTTTGGVLAAAPAAGDASIVVSRAAGSYGFLRLQTAGVNRWNLQVNNDAEAGSNAGSSLSLYAIGDTGTSLGSVFSVVRATQVVAFTQRPTFASKTPWDNGNLVNPATLDTAQTFTAAKTFGAATLCNGQVTVATNSSGSYTASTINLSSPAVPGFGFNAGGFGATLAYAGGSPGAFQFMDFQRSSYYPIVCSTLTQASDAALKADVAQQTEVLEKLRGKRTVTYVFKSDPSKARHIGVIAQEWQGDFPELVVGTCADIDEEGDFIAHQYDADGNEIFGPNGKPESRQALGFNYANASAVALQAAIELQDKLDAALARIAKLEAKAP
ncbi:tail fiber domain-containing protein [Paraburkholderia caledonica]|uniref:tail fiber domain-containing protein n=1 Tax=Paraburkholderia caledonica TaxID=134536 RepID=UPI000B401DD3|nr:tail fiber domain-containing protein [Paraburkholderia caledonica]